VAESEVEADREAVIGQLALQVERAQYEADRAERSYRSVEPENRLVARTSSRSGRSGSPSLLRQGPAGGESPGACTFALGGRTFTAAPSGH